MEDSKAEKPGLEKISEEDRKSAEDMLKWMRSHPCTLFGVIDPEDISADEMPINYV